MDVLRLAILAFIAAGVVLSISGVSAVMAVIISGGVTLIVMAIAIIRMRCGQGKKPEDEEPRGPTIQ